MENFTNNEVEQTIQAQQQPMEYLVFSGGGAKGAGYSGVHAALDDSGILPGIKAVAGSSAGSISAAAIATGISQDDYIRLTRDRNMKKLLGDEGFSLGNLSINKDGKPLLDLIATTVQKNVSSYLSDIVINQVVEQRLRQVQNEQLELSKIKNQIPENEFLENSSHLQKQAQKLEQLIENNAEELFNLKLKSDNLGKITFGDLDLLRLINPDKFKTLLVTATRKDNGELIIFDAKHSPNVEIAEACRASSSIPIVFKPYMIEGVEYVDGGYRDNIPLKYFDSEEVMKDLNLGVEDLTHDPVKIQEAKKQGRTMAFAFGEDMQDSANIAIYSAKEKIVDPGKLMAFLMDVVFKALSKVGGKFKYSEEDNKTFERLRDNALNTVVLDTGEIGTLSFDKAEEKAEYLHIKGYIQTMEYMNNHELGSKIDINLGHKNFLLGVYENSLAQSPMQSWQNRITGGHDTKMQDILDSCKDVEWVNKSPLYILNDVVVSAATKRTDGALSVDTNTMTKLVSKLNNSYTSEKVRSDFLELLKVDPVNDKRFDQNKTISDNLLNFKFTKNDFSSFLDKRQETVKENKDEKGSSVKTYAEAHKERTAQKKIEIYSKKEGSKADLVRNSLEKASTRNIK